jgi:hypothetical protein
MGRSVHDPRTRRCASLPPSLHISCALSLERDTDTDNKWRHATRPAGRKQRNTLIQVVVEVRSGSARFRVSVRARSIRRAIGLVRGNYPDTEASLVLPVEPESFFLGDDFDAAEQETFRIPERLLAG